MLLRVIIASWCIVTAANSAADVVDIYIAAGQSNMDGRGLNSALIGSLAPYAVPHDDALLHFTNPRDPVEDVASRPAYTSDGWVSLKPGYAIQPGFPSGGTLPGTRFGPVLSFGHAMASATSERRVAILKITRGNTNLASDWDPKDAPNDPMGYMYSGFAQAVPQAIQALEAQGHTVQVRGMIWHQGEGDGSGDSLATQQRYETNLTEFIQIVRKDLGIPHLPFLIGELESVDGGREAVRTAQANVAAAMEFVEFVPSNGLAVSDGTHFTPDSVIEFGNRFAQIMQQVLATIPKMSARVNSRTGEVLLTNVGEFPLRFDSYEIRSSAGALKPGSGHWNSLSDQGIDAIGPGNGQTWDEGGKVDSSIVTERFLLGETTLQPGEFVGIGRLIDLGIGTIEDMSLVLSGKQGYTLDGQVELFTPPGLPGDFNNDGFVNSADYIVWRNNLGDPDDSALNGNGDGMPGVDTTDYELWKTNFGTSSGVVSPIGSQQVPEPATLSGGAILVASLLAARRREWSQRGAPQVQHNLHEPKIGDILFS